MYTETDHYFPLQMFQLSNDEGHRSNYVKQKQTSRLQLEDFEPILAALDTLHNKGFVHSDVRAANLLFPENGVAKLIDFDLTELENTPYPLGYNAIHERHTSAKENMPRLKLHDRFSIAFIIQKQPFYSTCTNAQKNFFESVKLDQSSENLQTVMNL